MSSREALRTFAGGDEMLLTPYLGLIMRALEQRGVPASRVLEGTGLTLDNLLEPGTRIPAATCLQWIEQGLRLGLTPEMSMAAAAELDLRSHGFLGYAVLASPTLGDAIDMAVHYLATRTRLLEVRPFREQGQAVLQIDEGVPLGELRPWIIDGLMAAIFSICRQMFNIAPPPVSEIRFAYPEQPHHRLLREQSDGSLRFDCGFTQIRFPEAFLSLPVGTADPQLAQLAARQCEQELRQLQQQQSLLGKARQLAEQHLADPRGMESVARALHMTPRTLRRRLEALDTSYQKIVEELRRAMAMEALANSDSSVEQIAEQLGYNDPSNFGRAFRRWTGKSPRNWRRDRRFDQA